MDKIYSGDGTFASYIFINTQGYCKLKDLGTDQDNFLMNLNLIISLLPNERACSLLSYSGDFFSFNYI